MSTIGQLLQQYEQDNELTVLEPGKYRLQVIGCKATKTDVRPVFKVVGGPQDGKRVMAGVLSLNGNAASIFFQNMAGFGLKKEFFTALGADVSTEAALKAVADALKGRVADIEITADEWKGEPRNKIAIGKITLVEAPSSTSGGTAGVPVIPQQGGAPVLPQNVEVAATPVAAPAPAPAPAAPAPAPAPAEAAVIVQPDPPPAVQAPLPAEVTTPTPAPAPAPVPTPTVAVDDPGF